MSHSYIWFLWVPNAIEDCNKPNPGIIVSGQLEKPDPHHKRKIEYQIFLTKMVRMKPPLPSWKIRLPGWNTRSFKQDIPFMKIDRNHWQVSAAISAIVFVVMNICIDNINWYMIQPTYFTLFYFLLSDDCEIKHFVFPFPIDMALTLFNCLQLCRRAIFSDWTAVIYTDYIRKNNNQ